MWRPGQGRSLDGVSAGENTGPLVNRGDPSRSSQSPEVPLRTQSATSTITRAVTVAGGVFAPGHLGELTQYLPFELVDDVLEQTRTVQRRLRLLPARGGGCFGVGHADRRAGRPGFAGAVGEGPAGCAPPPGPGTAEGAV